MYLWIKALHVMAVISWMAGLFYLPRLFVYHAQTSPGAQAETFKTMERKLYRIIMRPALVMVWGSGLYLAYAGGHWREPWFEIKAVLVLGMSAFHFYCGALLRVFTTDGNRRSHVFYRYLNEAPTLLMIGVVIMAVVKPFGGG